MDLKMSPRDQIIAVGIAAAAIFLVAILFVLRPQFSQISGLRAEQAVELDKLEEAKLKLQRLDAIRQEATEIETKRIALSRRLPDEAELATLVVDLQKVANAAGLDFSAVEVETPVDQSGYTEIPFTLDLTGTFYSLVDYLYRLEKMTREIVIDGVTISSPEYPDLDIQLKAHVFKVTPSAAQLPPPPSQTPAAGIAPPAAAP